MRTRTSWRNQDILWRALGGKLPTVPKRDDVAFYSRILERTDICAKERRHYERAIQRAKFKALRKAVKP